MRGSPNSFVTLWKDLFVGSVTFPSLAAFVYSSTSGKIPSARSVTFTFSNHDSELWVLCDAFQIYHSVTNGAHFSATLDPVTSVWSICLLRAWLWFRTVEFNLIIIHHDVSVRNSLNQSAWLSFVIFTPPPQTHEHTTHYRRQRMSMLPTQIAKLS